MAVVYNSNQVKYGGRGYLDAKMQPVANLAALEALDSLELIEGMTIVVLNDGSGQPHDYWYIGGQWVKKDNGGGGDISHLEQEVAEISGNVETIHTTLADKVDKESGKGLSTNDFTNELKSKLDGVEEGAQVNVKANWKENDESSDAFIQNKPDLSGFATKDEVYTKEQMREELDETLDAAADYTDEVLTAATVGIMSSANTYADSAAAEAAQEALTEAETYTDSAITEAKQEVLNEAKEYADGKTEDLAGAALEYNEGKLDVQVDGTTITVNPQGKLHVIGGGSGGTQYQAGEYIDIEGDIISVTGITPDEYATKDELAEAMSSVTDTYATKEALNAEEELRYQLEQDLAEEVSRATSNEVILSNGLHSANTAIEAETSRAQSDETALESEIESALTESKSYADSKVGELDGDGLTFENGKLNVLVDGTTIIVDNETNKLHVIGGGGSGSTYIPGQYIKIENDVISVTGITPDDYATKEELEDKVDASAVTAEIASAMDAETARTENAYVKPEVLEDYATKDYVEDAVAGAISSVTEDVFTKEEINDKLAENLQASKDYTDEEITGVAGAVESEAARALSAETELHSEIVEEGTRAIESEEALDAKIDAEAARATTAETALSNEIAQESSRAHDAESALSTAIENEAERAELAESALSDALSDVQDKLEGLDNTTVKDYVDESISSAVSSVYKVKGSVEFYVDLPNDAEQGDVYNVETPSVVGDKSYPAGTNWVWVAGDPQGHWDPLGGTVDMSVVDAERARAISAETDLQLQINTKQDALVAGQYIDINGSNISVTGITPDDYATKTELEEGLSGVTEYVDGQGFAKQAHVDEQIAETRQGAFIAATAWTVSQGYAYEEDVIDTAVDLLNRITASTSASTELINQTASALTQSIEEEKERAQQAEADLVGAIEAEEARAISAETELEEAVQAESDRAQGAESGLHDAINAEKARAQETESGLRQLIDDEAERAELAESILEDAIEAEASRAASAESQLSESISQEAARAASAESQLSESVDAAMSAITEVSEDLNSAVERLEEEIEGATPVLTQDLTAAISVGGVSAGTYFSAGTSIESILIMLFGNGSTGEPTTQKYAYYGSVDDNERMYEEDPLPEEEFNEQNIKSRLTRSSAPVAASDEFEFAVKVDDNQIVVAIPATLAINTATDTTNNINYTGLEDGIVSLTIDSTPYKAYYYDSDAGFGQFIMKITLKNA